jgi:anti-sigma factor RsiW
MSTKHPSRDELFAMAYVDDELAPDDRRAFEARLAKEPALAAEVAALKRLELFARTAAPPEPIDLAWQAIDEDPLQKGTVSAGWLFAVAGLFGMSVMLAIALWNARLAPVTKLSIVAVVLGTFLLFVSVLRRRMRSLAFDPYTSVKR